MSLEDLRLDAMRCTRCAYCKWIPFDLVKSWRFSKGCPSIEYGKFHSYSAGGRLITALSLLEGRSTVTEKVKDTVFMCTLCGQCDVSCKMCRYDMEPLADLRELRSTLVQDGHELSQLQPVLDGLRKEFNMLGQSKKQRGNWIADLQVKDLTKEKAKIVFHAGCRYSFDGELSHVARTAVKILQKANVDFGIMGQQENCCGGHAYDMGYRKDFRTRADCNLKAWSEAGVDTVITPCSDCYFAFKRLYTAEAGSTIKVIHMVEFVDQLIKAGQLKFTKPVAMTVTYHDPCHLGRQGETYVPWAGKEKKIFGQAVCYEPPRPRYNGAFGIYEPPRDVLKAIPGLKLVEMERIKEAAWCCGAGGGASQAYPEFSRWTATERIEEAKSTGADAIVSACPWCERNFLDATSGNDTKMKVLDIMELVEQAL
ncbi:MAG: (Fe-S)-binding protein [Candidatus Korobacteraceae bacterium]